MSWDTPDVAPARGPIQPHEWGEWRMEMGYSKSTWMVFRTARLWHRQYLNAKGEVKGSPSHFRSSEAAKAAITKAAKNPAPPALPNEQGTEP